MRAYRILLHLYPASFRATYGGELCAIFRRRRREASGPLAVVALWIGACAEVVANAAAVHWDILRQDLRFAIRSLGRARGFALTVMVLIALGVGATTAAFSVTDFVLIRPLPYPDAPRLTRVWQVGSGYESMEFSPANFRDWKRLSTSFENMGAFVTAAVNLVGGGEPQRVDSAMITADLFPTLGASPARGRLFTAADDRPGAPGTLILSDGLWKRVFGGDPGILGRQVTLDDGVHTVIGVMPADFSFPTRDEQLWVPARLPERAFEDRNDNYLEVVARLKPGVTLDAANAEMDVVGAQLRQQYPKDNEHTSARANGFRDELSQQSRLLLLALSGAALCVLLIVCANVANLLLARSLGRRRELAVRSALGGGRQRLMRQLATETVVLSVLGGVSGVFVSTLALPLLATLVPESFPVAHQPSLDLRTLTFALAATLVTGFIFGLAPALRASDADPRGLREDARAGGGRKERLRSALVIAEVIASVVLLISSGLLMRAMLAIQARDPGFRAENVLTLRTALPFPRYGATATRAAFYNRVLGEIRALPGVERAAYISAAPMLWGGGIWPVGINGDLLERTAGQTASMRYATPGFFATMGIPLRAGRDISESDTTSGQLVAVVSESFVRRYWPDKDPLGRHFKFAFQDRTVVGVVGDLRVRGLERPSEPQVYLPYNQVQDKSFLYYAPKDVVVRSASSPLQLVPAIRAIVNRADPQQPVSNVRTMTDILEANTASRAVQLRVLGAFAAVAFLLAGIGIHGLLSFTVSQRTPEIGVRMALGAQRADILGMILKRSVLLATTGVVPGVLLAWMAGRALKGLLADVPPTDPITFAVAIGLTIVMVLGGTLLPTVRAVNVDAVQAIRGE